MNKNTYVNVVHIALTPVAGSPINIVNALNKYTSFVTKLIILYPDAYGNRIFENDLEWSNDKDLCIKSIQSANILHFHHFFDLKDNPFKFDFTQYIDNKIMVRQFHSTPHFIADGDPDKIKKIQNSTIPQIVISQHQERYYPNARMVPNIVPIYDKGYLPINFDQRLNRIYFAPTVTKPFHVKTKQLSRWDTKGYYETKLTVNSNIRHSSFSLKIHKGQPHKICLLERQKSKISIDEMITGSYHLSSLESLSQGVPTLAFLDKRVLSNIKTITGADSHPWINTTLENSKDVIQRLMLSDDYLEEIGIISRNWMEKYYSDEKIIQHYVDVYEDLMNSKPLVERDKFNKISYNAVLFRELDNDFLERAQQFPSFKLKSLCWINRIFDNINQLFSTTVNLLNKILRIS